MNDTTAIGVQPQMQDVQEYVAAVRSWLADLPGEEVEDLTAGMEADLAERAAETGERLGVLLGEPEAYAAELRSAAGLPPRAVPSVLVAPRGPGLIALATASARAKGDGILTRWPWLRELRPTRSLARGAVLGWLLAAMLGTGRTVALPLIGAGVSLWLGFELRRREPLRAVARVAMGGANALAAIALLPMMSTYTSGFSSGYDVEGGMPLLLPQVTANGEELRNLYAYDAAGNRVDGVRLFDQSGNPVFINVDNLMDGTFDDLPTRPEDGMPDVAADVFPLTWQGRDTWGESGYGWTPPLVLAPVVGYPAVPDPSVSGLPTPSSAPTTSPSLQPSSAASGTPTPSPSPSVSATP